MVYGSHGSRDGSRDCPHLLHVLWKAGAAAAGLGDPQQCCSPFAPFAALSSAIVYTATRARHSISTVSSKVWLLALSNLSGAISRAS
jgi:hypothetical protein